MTYTDEELLDALREYAADHDGRPPTRAEADDPGDLPGAKTYKRRFGSWNEALEAAGFAPHERRWSDQELLDALREYAADHDGRPPTIAEANDPSRELPVAQTFINRFGGWNAVVEAAGFAPRDRRRSKEDLLDALSAFAADHDGRPPTVTEANDPESELPVAQTFLNHFGSWNAAIAEAGFEPRDRRRTDEELLDALQGLAAELDERPTTAAVADRADMASPGTYANRFGSWNDALREAGLVTFDS